MKALKRGVTLKRRLDFTLDCASADITECSSVDVKGGALCALPSLTRLSTRSAFQGVFGRIGGSLYLHSNNKVYRYDGALQELAAVNDGIGKPCSVTYRGKIITSIKSSGTYLIQGSSFTRLTDDVYDDLTVAGERVFALSGNTVFFSEVGEHNVGGECQYVELPAPCNALTTLNGSAYALGNECYRISPSADYSSFQVSAVAAGVGEVQRDSVAVLGDRAVFAATSGLFCLSSGGKIKRIFTKIRGNLNFNGCFASVLRGGYLLSLPQTANRPTLLLDIDGERCVSVFGVNIGQTDVYLDKLYAVYVGGLFKGETDAAEYNDEMRYKVSDVDFHVGAVKYLRYMLIKTNNPADVYLSNETETRLIRVNGKNRVQRIPLFGSGRKFSVYVKSTGNTKIEYLELVAEAFKENNYGDK